jgi:hypothetical protein
MANNDVRTTCIAANVTLPREITEVSFLKNHLSMKLVLWVVKYFKNTVDVLYNTTTLHSYVSSEASRHGRWSNLSQEMMNTFF